MAFRVDVVTSAKLKHPPEEVERFIRAKRYVRDVAGEKSLRLGLLAGIPVPPDLAPRWATLKYVGTYRWTDGDPVVHGFRMPYHVALWCAKTGRDPYEFKNPMHDVTRSHFGWLVSDAAKSLIEAHDPGRHQFFPFAVLKRGGTRLERPFWLLNVSNRLDTVDPEHSTVVKVGPDLKNNPDRWWYRIVHSVHGSHRLHDDWTSFRYTHRRYPGGLEAVRVGLGADHPPTIALRKERIGDHAIWWDYRLNDRVFLSDALHAAFMAAKMDEIRASYIPEV